MCVGVCLNVACLSCCVYECLRLCLRLRLCVQSYMKTHIYITQKSIFTSVLYYRNLPQSVVQSGSKVGNKYGAKSGNLLLSLGVCFPQPCSSTGRTFAAYGSCLNCYWLVCSFPHEICWNMFSIKFHWDSAIVQTIPFATLTMQCNRRVSLGFLSFFLAFLGFEFPA